MVTFNEDDEVARTALLKRQEEESLASVLSKKYGVPYLDLSAHPINIDALRIVKEADARASEIAVFNLTDKNIDVGVLSPENDKAKLAISELENRGYNPTVYMVSHASLNKVWDRYKDMSYSFETTSGALDISSTEILEIVNKVHVVNDVKLLIEEVLAAKKSYRISKILEIILRCKVFQVIFRGKVFQVIFRGKVFQIISGGKVSQVIFGHHRFLDNANVFFQDPNILFQDIYIFAEGLYFFCEDRIARLSHKISPWLEGARI